MFIGRRRELESLSSLKSKKSSSLVVISGRRRIGKSRLIEEFGKQSLYYSFSGLPPTPSTTDEYQRKSFALQLEKYFHVPIRHESWYELLKFLADQVQEKEAVVLLDEISWIGSKDPEFLGVLKTVWDQHFKKNSRLILVLCGSISYWIEKNILSSTAFLGRVSLHLHLKELSLEESAKFWTYPESQISPYEILKVLGCLGGIPRYLEEVNPKETAEENIKRLCFSPSGPLYKEFDQIFSDLFSAKAPLYKNIVQSLVNGPLERNDLAKAIHHPLNGTLTEYLDNLILAGFIQRDFTWTFQTKTLNKVSKYRLSDNYVRFYLKYIEGRKPSIDQELLENAHLTSLPGWHTIMGLQIENLVLNNKKSILKALKIPPEIVINQGPYFQRKTERIQGCQIDYLVQTKLNELYVGEIKFSQNEIKRDVIDATKLKIKKLNCPKGFSIRPFLIHVNGVNPSVQEEDYFTNIITLGDLLS